MSHNLLGLTACTPSHKALGSGSIPQPLRDFTKDDYDNFIQSMDAPEPCCQSVSRGIHFLFLFLALPCGLRDLSSRLGIKPMPPHPSPPTGRAEC